MPTLKLCLFVFCITAGAAQNGDSTDRQCFNHWKGDLASRYENCNIFGRPTIISMSCRINIGAKETTSLQWFYASTRDAAGREGGVVLDNSTGGGRINFNYTVTVQQTQDEKERVATLVLRNEFVEGYYWCMITGAMASSFQNPSQVIQISTTCHLDTMCSKDELMTVQRDLGRCANGNYRESVTVVDLQNTSSCMEGPTDGKEGGVGTEGVTNGEETDESPQGDVTVVTKESLSTTFGTPGTEEQGDGVFGGLTNGVIWLIVGVGIALLLVVIALLLVIIACLHCSRRKVKDNYNETLPHHFDNLAYLSTEPDLLDSYATPSDAKQQDTNTGNHTYAVIPENFTLSAFSDENGPTALQTKQPRTVDGDNYEIIDLDPLPNTTKKEGNSSTRMHQYEAVAKEEDGEDYNRLQRSDSKCRNASFSTGASTSPISPSRGESVTPLSPALKESILFDNPMYSQLGSLSSQQVGICKAASVNSNSGAGYQGQGGDLGVNQNIARKVSSQKEDDEYFHDSSMFIVNGLVKDETKRPAAVNTSAPSEHYSALLPSTMNEESSYARAIVSSDEKYISEKGHLYQVLEGGESELDSMERSEQERWKGNCTSLSSESKEYEEELCFMVGNPDACSSDEDIEVETGTVQNSSSTSIDSRTLGGVYQTLHTPISRESTPGQTPYDVINRSMKHSVNNSRNSLDAAESAYNVIDRRVSDGNFVVQPSSGYDMIEPQARRKSEGNLIENQVSQYSIIEPHGQSKRISDGNFSSRIPSQYDVIELDSSLPSNSDYSKISHSRNHSSFSQDAGSSQRPIEPRNSHSSLPPPSYKSLVDKKLSGASPFISAAEQEAHQERDSSHQDGASASIIYTTPSVATCT